MAKRICDLYEDFDALREMSDKGKQSSSPDLPRQRQKNCCAGYER